MKARFIVWGRRLTATLVIVIAALSTLSSSAVAAPLMSPPTNDDINSATDITSLVTSAYPGVYTNTDIPDITQATPQTNPDPLTDPTITYCLSDPGLETVWYTYTAPQDGELHVDTFGSGFTGVFDPVLAIWTGTPGNLTPIMCNYHANGTFNAEVRFPIVNNTQYYIEVANLTSLASSLSAPEASGPSAQSTNNLVLNVSYRPTPVTNPAPSTPSLVAPGNGAVVNTYWPTLDWNNSTLGAGFYLYDYELEVSKNSNLTSPVLTTKVFGLTNSNYTPLTAQVLDSNTTYYWHVRACNSYAPPTNGQYGQCSGWSVVRNFHTTILPPTLSAPANGPAVNVLRPTFDWENITGASSYYLQVSKNSNFTALAVNTTISGASNSTFTPLKDLPINTTLYWRVRANASAGNFGPSAWSDVWNFKTPNPPSIPSLVSPANNLLTYNLQPTFDWNNSTVPLGIFFDHYELQLATDSGFTSIVPTPFTATGDITASNLSLSSISLSLSTNTKYYWRVRSCDNNSNCSSWSAVWTLREAVDPPTLTAPANQTATPQTSRRPTFIWSQPDTNYVTGYNIQVSTVSTFTSTVLNVNTGTVSQTYTPTGDLPANSNLYWRVHANGANGPSVWSSPVWSFKTPNPPSTPGLVSPINNVLLTNLQPTLDWNNSTVPLGTTFDHYQIQVDDNSDFSSPVIDADTTPQGDITASSYVPASPFSVNTKYYWRVRAWDNSNFPNGNYSAWSVVQTFREAVDPPSLSSPADGIETVLRPTFTWTPPADPTNVTGYTIQVSKLSTFSSLVLSVNTTGTTYMPSANLPGGSKLYWRVRTNGSNGPSNWSSPTWSISTPNGPPLLSAPGNTSVVTTTTPTLSWVVPSLATGTSFDHYEVQIATNATFTSPVLDDFTTLTSVTPGQYTVGASTLSADTLYYWRVSYSYKDALNNPYQTAWSSTWSFKTSIGAPTLVAPTNGLNPETDPTPAFDWSDVAGALSYSIQVSTSPTFGTFVINVTVSGATNSAYTPTTNLMAGTTYYWRVRANAASGHYGPSAWSTPTWSFTP